MIASLAVASRPKPVQADLRATRPLTVRGISGHEYPDHRGAHHWRPLIERLLGESDQELVCLDHFDDYYNPDLKRATAAGFAKIAHENRGGDFL